MNDFFGLDRHAEHRTLPKLAISAASLLAGLLIGALALPGNEASRAAASDQVSAPSAADETTQGSLSTIGYLNEVGEAIGSD